MKLKTTSLSLLPIPFILMGCSQPKFEIETHTDKFRDIKHCSTKNNVIETSKGNFSFDLMMGEGQGKDYFVSIDHDLKYNRSLFGKYFFPGDYLILTVDDTRTIKLKLSSYSQGENLSCSAGTFQTTAPISQSDMMALIKAKSIKFDMELYRSAITMTGQFSQKNLKQLKEFQHRCIKS